MVSLKWGFLMPVFFVQLTGLTAADKEALNLLVKAATIMDKIFYVQV